jgi:glycosyltransferase involved in cell wall biosynthesis
MARILQIVISGEMAGGQKVCLEIIQDRFELGDTLFVASPSRGPFTQQCPEGTKTNVLPFQSLHDLDKLPQLVSYLDHAKPDLVHTHTTVPGNILWRLACRITGIPIINHVHTNRNFFGSKRIKGGLVRLLDTLTARIPKYFIAVSRHTADSLMRQGYPRDRIRVIYNGVSDEAPLAKSRISKNPTDDRPILGCVGRLCERKGQKDLMKAFRKILDNHPSATLWLIGNDQQKQGEYESELRCLAESLGITGRMVFWGHQDGVKKLMDQMDILVLPSYDEGFPLVLLEAMSIGLPVIASGVAGIPEMIVDGETGILIPPGNIGAIGDGIERLMSSPLLRKSLGEKGQKRALKEFSKEKMLRQVRELYAAIIDEKHETCH